MRVERVCESCADQNHLQDIEAIVVIGGRVFSGADDGIVKIWSCDDLKLIHEFKAHDYAIIHLLIVKDRLYTASMDQTVKSWQMDTWKLVATFTDLEETPRRLATDGENIFCGDDKGEVLKWTKDGELLARYGMVEEVWDLHIQNPYIYTIRDRGLTISATQASSGNTSVVRSLEGRAPMFIHKEDLVMLDRTGIVINHFRNEPPAYEYIKELKGHEKIITVMSGWKGYLLTSGYDEKLFIWDLKSGQLLTTSQFGECPAALCINEDGDVFIACGNCSIVKLKLLP